MSGADHYEVLNVERTASAAEIKTAYRKLVRQVHPDQGGNAALFRLVQEAWNTLSDPAKRASYDRLLAGQSTTTTREPDPQPHPDPQPEPEPTWTWSTDQPWSSTSSSSSEQPEQPRTTGERVQPVDAGPILVGPPFGRWRAPALVALTVFCALVIWILVSIDYHGFWDVVFGVGTAAMIVVAMPPHWSRRVPLGGLFKTLGVLTAAFFLLALILTFNPFAASGASTVGRILLGAVVAGLVVVRILTGRWSKAHALDLAIDRTAAYEFNLWGRPGEPLVDDALAAPISAYDVLLQRRTASLLDPVVGALPAAKLVHGAQLGAVAVDHMLLNGHRVALIVSLVGSPGAYSLDAYGSLVFNGQPIDSPVPALEAAVAAWSGRLRTAQVRGFLIVHPTVEGQGRIMTDSGSEAAVTCLSARSADRELLNWLEPDGNVLDRRLLYDVLRRAPYGLI
ncbi:J domain-containing protein [Kribbella sp. VKM Ac-2566]|uniref:J domain-containing protein n=1 Tax=Kribbella sp. VKM Ac-2566 TaxID=2512218 RepID=UPI001062E7A9|nr:J domain-containing protein [Kribbella sp. VKM Ac-2566]TDW97877.1 DnaJ-like protein [Kribbella sp. VKM Ac-2566]